MELSQEHLFTQDERGIIELFCDARGFPARLAAVIFIDGNIVYTDWAPPPHLLRIFESRKDSQIMGLELLAIALGLSTFLSEVADRKVRIWCDNVGGEQATRKGAAKQFDHNCIVHCLWLFAARFKIALQIERVPSEYNIADLPSREEHETLRALGAEWVRPVLQDAFWRPQAWESLSLVTNMT